MQFWRGFTKITLQSEKIREDRDLSLNYCLKAYELNPNLAQTQSCMGWYMHIEGNNDEAFKHFFQALKLNPNNFAVNQLVGLIYQKIGLDYQAIEFYKKAVELDPFYIYSIWNLADCYMIVGDYEKALLYYDKCLELSSQTPWFLYPSYADLLIRNKNYQKAGQIIEKMEFSNLTLPALPMIQGLYLSSTKNEKIINDISKESPEVLSLLKQETKAVDKLQSQINENGMPFYLGLINNPFYENLRENPYFLKLVEDQKLIYDYRLKRYGNLNNLDY